MPLSKEPVTSDVKPVDITAKVTDAAKVKTYLQSAGVKLSDMNKLAWGKPDEIIESVVKLHGASLENYRAGGLG